MKRRKRYSVTFTDGSREVILAHTAFLAKEHFLRQGLSVQSVAEGDYRAPIAPSGAKVDRENLDVAIAFFNLKHPVKIIMSGRAKYRRGLCQTLPSHWNLIHQGTTIYGGEFVAARKASWTHHITLSTKQTAKDMGESLWHELAHAMQFERDTDMSGTVRDVLRATHAVYYDGTSYENKPYEVEANSYMEQNNELPLAR